MPSTRFTRMAGPGSSCTTLGGLPRFDHFHKAFLKSQFTAKTAHDFFHLGRVILKVRCQWLPVYLSFSLVCCMPIFVQKIDHSEALHPSIATFEGVPPLPFPMARLAHHQHEREPWHHCHHQEGWGLLYDLGRHSIGPSVVLPPQMVTLEGAIKSIKRWPLTFGHLSCYCWWFERNPKQPPKACIKPSQNNGLITISAGAGFLPSTVWSGSRDNNL